MNYNINKEKKQLSPNELIRKDTKKYLDYSKKTVSKTKSYVENLTILNKNTGEINNMSYDFIKKEYDRFLWIVFQSLYLQNDMKKKGNKVAYFITNTLPTEYHPYNTHDRRGKKLAKPIHNPRYDKECDINTGYKLLNSSFRSLIKDWKVDTDKYNRLFYQRVVEPHKSLVPHLHGLVYVDEEYAEDFEEYYEKKCKMYGLGRHEITRVENIERSSTYLLKYISKNLNIKDDENKLKDNTKGNTFHGWRTYNSINVYTYSKTSIPKYIFSKVSNVLRLDIQDGSNILEVIESIINLQINIYENKQIISTKEILKENARYDVLIEKEKVSKTVKLGDWIVPKMDILRKSFIEHTCEQMKINTDELLELTYNWGIENEYIYDDDLYDYRTTDLKYTILQDMLYEIADTETLTSYKIITFTLYDKKTDKKLYDKNDYELLT